MIFAAHQPNYLPWLGYFYKVWVSDLFVILDDVQFERGRGYQNRVQIKTANGPAWLTQPVRRKGQGLQPTLEVEFSEPGWADKHLRTIRANYARAPHFRALFPQIEAGFAAAGPRLADTNFALIERVSQLLGLATRFVRSSDHGLALTGGERIAELGRLNGATRYVSGKGGAGYQVAESFARRGIALAYSGFRPAPYPQLWGDFVPGLSILDALFNAGPEAIVAAFAATPAPAAAGGAAGETAPCR